MATITRDLLRKRSEHNECMISTMEELTLHQEELVSIDECLGQSCRHLKILLLQNNIINKMENLHHLKSLEYLNLALNNIRKIEGVERCEFLNKLDLTINFIDLDDLESSIDNLVDRSHLVDLFMMGNPCEQDWKGFKNYVIARLPQLKQLDGTEVTRSMKITAAQQLPALVSELRGLAKERRERRDKEEEEQEKERRVKEEKKKRKEEKREAIESGKVVVEDVGESSEEENDDEELTGHTPEVRNEIYKEMAEQKAEKEAREKENQPQYRGEKEFEAQQKEAIDKARTREDRGEVRQCNEGKWPFRFDEDAKKGYVQLDVTVQKHLSSTLIDVDVNPDYVSIVIKSKVLRLVLPAEVEAEGAVASRSKTTGHLVVTMKKVDPNENMVALRAARKHAEKKVADERRRAASERAAKEGEKLGAQMLLSGSVQIEGMVSRSKGGVGAKDKVDIGMSEVKTTVSEKAKKGGGGKKRIDFPQSECPPPINVLLS
ncbi:hypothetical protein TrRE_jg10733 [Triparma retinervis]|uniref:Dynein axonemal assembly factor 11-like CS domain-containing protein n=1 Tax=Triparma retinervis TaxID=2557542 RepID=A0A9W7CJB5_9STRA|nr:hypothetical protein TrRE_jg10733 [Triparma retinervis]